MTQQEQLRPHRPTHRAYMVRDGKPDGKGRWIEIGAAWLHKDGRGFRVKLDACPTNGEPIECRLIDWKAIAAGGKEPAPEDTAPDY